ncbi:GSCFA domain-containing protein [Hymenobacter sp. BT190]|uniref:GSCFA domain-containing protein n=1 Tax=Hymenobacter sp. BT190 TaxID=2763505 RepID=UPI001651445A|nr:GSCFA domain-containing protein [Hymenobacter sp. BT190]MBC6696638.1 GSCFA domain-containing protein [Hymenobacter sp. BT190]
MFRTELPLPPHPHQLPLSARVLTIGSCFSESIGSRLAADKVPTLANPFGTVFNPLAACRLLRAAAGEDQDWQQHLVEARGRWQSLDLHSTIGAESPVDLLQQLQQLLRDTGVFVATADVVVLTLGSAWVYRYKETGELVSNCHKLPAEKFDKELLTPDELINAVAETHAYLRLHNPKLRFILTVSPVRHAKDTLPLNAVSKSVLRVACHYLSELLPDVSYFPAYELLLDDLRDYRFYAEDMLHPSKVAEDYIWERFARTYFDAGFGRFRREWEAVRQALSHRPLYAAAPEHRQFLESTLARLERLASQADVRMELLEIRHQLQNLPVPTVKPEPAPEDDGEERIDIGTYAAPVPAKPVLVAPVEVEEVEEFEEFESIRNEAAPDSFAAEDSNDEDSEATAETDTAAILDGLAPKKKRRSRGGAKRNKKKHAARLAAELAAQEGTAVVTAVNADGQPIASVQHEASTPLPAAPAVSILADPDMAPQTAMERRKRNSRRGRGRDQQNVRAAEHAEDTTATESSTSSSPAAEDVSEQPAPAVSPMSSTAPTPQPADVFEEAVATTDTGAVETDATQRPARTGRSASEKRADALRKPHRAGSRLKPLYVAQAEPGSQPQGKQPESAAEMPVKAEPAIPVTIGTGASGRLTESGKATLTARAAVSVAAAPILPAQEAASLVSEPDSTIPTEVAAAPSAADTLSAGSESSQPALAKKAKATPRRAPARKATTAAAVATPVVEQPHIAKPTRARAPRKPPTAPKAAPVAEVPVAAAPAASPPTPVRKAATSKKPAAEKTAAAAGKAAPAKKAAAKKPTPPVRSKKKPDTPADQ